MKKSVILCLVTAALVSGIILFTDKVIMGADSGSDSVISAKLDEVLSNQKTIMSQMESLKQELSIIKIRITQQQ